MVLVGIGFWNQKTIVVCLKIKGDHIDILHVIILGLITEGVDGLAYIADSFQKIFVGVISKLDGELLLRFSIRASFGQLFEGELRFGVKGRSIFLLDGNAKRHGISNRPCCCSRLKDGKEIGRLVSLACLSCALC